MIAMLIHEECKFMAQKQEEIALEDYQPFSIKTFQFEKKNLTRATFVLLRNDAANGMTD